MTAIAAGVGVGKEGRACAPADFTRMFSKRKKRKAKQCMCTGKEHYYTAIKYIYFWV